MIVKYAKWLFWSTYYLIVRNQTDLVNVIEKQIRIKPPWYKFKPFVSHNVDGKQWEMFFSNNYDYTKTLWIKVSAHVDEHDEITGIIVNESTLKAGSINRRLDID